MNSKNKLNRTTPLGWVNYALVGLLAVLCGLPMILVLAISLTSDKAIKMNGYQLIPSEFSYLAYRVIFSRNSSAFRSYFISISVTSLGTLVAVAITFMAAFTLVNKSVR